MKKFILLLCYCTILSCANKNTPILSEEKVSQLRTNFAQTLMEYDSLSTIDSFRFIQLDTLTDMAKLVLRIRENNNKAQDLLAEVQSARELIKLKYDRAAYGSVLSNSLYVMYKKDADETKKKYDDKLHEAIALTDQVDSMVLLRTKTDSLAPVAYQAVCFYQIRAKDMSVKRDTTWIFLNLNKDIITQEDFLNK